MDDDWYAQQQIIDEQNRQEQQAADDRNRREQQERDEQNWREQRETETRIAQEQAESDRRADERRREEQQQLEEYHRRNAERDAYDQAQRDRQAEQDRVDDEKRAEDRRKWDENVANDWAKKDEEATARREQESQSFITTIGTFLAWGLFGRTKKTADSSLRRPEVRTDDVSYPISSNSRPSQIRQARPNTPSSTTPVAPSQSVRVKEKPNREADKQGPRWWLWGAASVGALLLTNIFANGDTGPKNRATVKITIKKMVGITPWQENYPAIARTAKGHGEIKAVMAQITKEKRKYPTIYWVQQEGGPIIGYLMPPAKKLSSRYNVVSCSIGSWPAMSASANKQEDKTDLAIFPVPAGVSSSYEPNITKETVINQHSCKDALLREAERRYPNEKKIHINKHTPT